MKKILIVTGELSGFNYAREIIKNLRSDFDIYGVLFGNVEGAKTLIDSRKLTSFGLFESMIKLPYMLLAERELKKFILNSNLDAVLLIDFPWFNLRLAKFARNHGIKTFYFISPKFWAWGKNRVESIKASVDRMFVVFPFEVELYKKHGMDVTYVGNPVVDIARPNIERHVFLEKYGFSSNILLISLLPGSRDTEIKYLLRPMLQAAVILKDELKTDFVLPIASSISNDFVLKNVGELAPFVKVIPESDRFNAMAYSDVGILSSGTASLEAALLGLPHVILYKLNPLTYWIARRLVKLNRVSLPNIITKKSLVPELLQANVTPKRISTEVKDVLSRKDDIKRAFKENIKLNGDAIKTLCHEIRLDLANGA